MLERPTPSTRTGPPASAPAGPRQAGADLLSHDLGALDPLFHRSAAALREQRQWIDLRTRAA